MTGGTSTDEHAGAVTLRKGLPAPSTAAMGDTKGAGSDSSDDIERALPRAGYEPRPPKASIWVNGDPGPFGLLCFGMTTCMLMFITTQWSTGALLTTVFSYALFYGGIGQFVAGILELIKGNTFGGTAFASYGCFWMGWWMLEFLAKSNPAVYGAVDHTGKSLWAGLWAFLTLGFFVVTLRKNGCLQTIFSTLVITFSLLSAGQWNANCEQAAGYIGFFCGASAIYAAFAMLYKIELGWMLPGMRATKYV